MAKLPPLIFENSATTGTTTQPIETAGMKRIDSLTIRPSIKWVLTMLWCYLLWIADRFSTRYVLIGFCIFLPSALLIGVSIAKIIDRIIARRFLGFISELIGPLVTACFLGVVTGAGLDPDWLHFQIKKDCYLKLVSELPGKPPKYHEWDKNWTGAFAAVANMSYRLVYDDSDKPLSHSIDDQSTGFPVSARPLGEHFFIVGRSFE